MGKKIFAIRIVTFLVIVLATFAVGWYLFVRYLQIEGIGDSTTRVKEELNTPRLNDALVKEMNKRFKERRLYKGGENINVTIPEEDPFYD